MKPDQTDPGAYAMQTKTKTLSTVNSPAEPGARVFQQGIIPTDCLFQGSQEILISHNGEHYRLRITKNGKLILTK